MYLKATVDMGIEKVNEGKKKKGNKYKKYDYLFKNTTISNNNKKNNLVHKIENYHRRIIQKQKIKTSASRTRP